MDRVGDQETLARYILTDSWLYKDNRPGSAIRPNALLPLPSVQLSVYRTDWWDENEINQKGAEVAAAREASHKARELANGRNYPAGKTTFRHIGRGVISASDVRSVGLDVVPDEPPPKHADIVGWPALSADRKVDEAAQMAYALKLQAKIRFVPAPNSPPRR